MGNTVKIGGGGGECPLVLAVWLGKLSLIGLMLHTVWIAR